MKNEKRIENQTYSIWSDWNLKTLLFKNHENEKRHSTIENSYSTWKCWFEKKVEFGLGHHWLQFSWIKKKLVVPSYLYVHRVVIETGISWFLSWFKNVRWTQIPKCSRFVGSCESRRAFHTDLRSIREWFFQYRMRGGLVFSRSFFILFGKHISPKTICFFEVSLYSTFPCHGSTRLSTFRNRSLQSTR